MRDRTFNLQAGQPARQRGLTLIELLVAITILAFIAVLGWRGLDSIVRTRITLTDEMERTRGLQLAFAQLQSDCAHLADTDVLPGRVPVLIESGQLKLIRTVLAENQPSRLQVVTYRLREGVLSRQESPETRNLVELDMLWLGASGNTDETSKVVLQTGITAFDLRLWIGNGWRNGAEALASTGQPSTGLPLQQQPLPTGLEVKLQLNGHKADLTKIFLLGVV